MGLIRRKQRLPEPLEYGTSFAAAATRPKRRLLGRSHEGTYDVRMMEIHHPGEPAFVDPDAPPSFARRVARRLGSTLLLLVALGLVVGIAGAAWMFAGKGSDQAPGKPVHIVVPASSDANQIADLLAEKGIVDNETVFRARLKLNGDGASFRSGAYTMKTGSSYDTIVRVLEKGPAALPTFNVNLPEGMRVEEAAAHIDSLRAAAGKRGDRLLPAFTGAQWLAAVKAHRVPAKYSPPKGTRSMEGFLFPATYELRETAKAEDLVRKQLDAFDNAMASIDLTRAKKANLTPYDIVTIASLIEREAQVDAERPKVAAVIWNRLKDGEALYIDASHQYFLYKRGSGEFWPELKFQSDIDADSPYNLRENAGLPPTPIANPGLASLKAAANPAKGDLRYYIADPAGSGTHHFHETLDAFNADPYQQG